jgi:glycosyltransferase involved in cell wall biosynthesis
MPTLALCMITKNEELLLEKAIISVKSIVDEIIVVDTGSTDKTIEIAKSLGAKVHEIAWEDDFSKAKNYATSKANTDWILFLDADEYISKQDAIRIRQLMENNNSNIVAFSFISRHYTKIPQQQANWIALKDEDNKNEENKDIFKDFLGYYDVKYITRLFQKNKNIFFQGAVHEDVNPSIFNWDKEEGNKKIQSLEFPIHHLHALKQESFVEDKQKQYFEISKRKAKENPDAKTYLDLAVGYALFENNIEESISNYFKTVELQIIPEEKLEEIKQLIKNKRNLGVIVELTKLLDMSKHDFNSIVNLAKAYYKIKHYKKSLAILKRLHSFAPKDPTILELMGVCYANVNLINDAIAVFKLAIQISPNNPNNYFNLGAIYEKARQYRNAMDVFNKAIILGHSQADALKQRIKILKDIAGVEEPNFTVNIGESEDKKIGDEQ